MSATPPNADVQSSLALNTTLAQLKAYVRKYPDRAAYACTWLGRVVFWVGLYCLYLAQPSAASSEGRPEEAALHRFAWTAVAVLPAHFLVSVLFGWRAVAANRRHRRVPKRWILAHVLADWTAVTLVGAMYLNPFSEIHMAYTMVLVSAVLFQEWWQCLLVAAAVVVGSVAHLPLNLIYLRMDEKAIYALPPWLHTKSESSDELIASIWDAYWYRQLPARIGTWSIAALAMALTILYRREREKASWWLRRVIDEVPGCVFIKDKDRRFLMANGSLTTILGLKESQILGKTDQQVNAEHPELLEHWPEYAASDMKCLTAPLTIKAEFKGPEPDFAPLTSAANRKILTIKRRLMRNPQTVEGLVGICIRDTEAITVADRAIFLEDVLDMLPHPVLLKREDKTFHFINLKFAEECVGLVSRLAAGGIPNPPLLSPADARRYILRHGLKDEHLYDKEHADQYGKTDRELFTAHAAGKPICRPPQRELHRLLDQAEGRWVSVSKLVIGEPVQKTPMIFGIFWDVDAEHRLAESWRFWAERFLPLVVRMFDDKRTAPPAKAVAISEWVVAGKLLYLRAIESQGTLTDLGWKPCQVDVGELIRAHVAFMKEALGRAHWIEVGKIGVGVEDVDPTRLSAALTAMLINASRAIDEQLKQMVARLLDSQQQLGTGTALQQDIFRAINDIRQNPGIYVSVERAADYLRIKVVDKGLGFAPTDRQMLLAGILHRFSDGKGSGIRVANAVAAASKGSFDLTSEGPGFGATATLYIPLGTAKRSSEIRKPAIPRKENSRTPVAPPGDVPNVAAEAKKSGKKTPNPGWKNETGVRIAISYASKDAREEVRMMANAFQTYFASFGEIWWDASDIAGSRWAHEIERRFTTADIILPVLTEGFFESQYIQTKEYPLIRSRGEKTRDEGGALVVPIRLKENLSGHNQANAMCKWFAERKGAPAKDWLTKSDSPQGLITSKRWGGIFDDIFLSWKSWSEAETNGRQP